MRRSLNSRLARVRVAAAVICSFGIAAAAPPAHAVDTPVPLNYNARIMAHASDVIPGATAQNADSPTNHFRALADRGFYFNANDPNTPGGLPLVGSTGGVVTSPFSYSMFNSLGHGNSTWAGAATYEFDGVFIGNRALNFAPDLLINPDGNTGPFPAWAPAVTVSTISASGGVVTATTSAAHGFTAGSVVLMGGAIPALYNGPFVVASVPNSTTFTYVDTVTTSAAAQMFAGNIAVSSMTFASPTLTVNTASQHGFAVGQSVSISGSLASVAPPQGYNTTYTVAAVNSMTQFTVTVSNGATGTASARMYVNDTIQATSLVCDVNGIVTATTGVAHGLSGGNAITISGANVLPFNGAFTVATVTDTTHFTYAITPIGTMRASGVAGGIGLTSLSGDGATVTAVTAAPHFFATGQTVTISNVTPAGYNASPTITVPSINPTTITSTTTTATVTNPTPHGFLVGQTIVVSGASIANHNGKFTIASTATPTTFTYAITSQSGTSSAATIRNFNVFTYANAATGSATGAFMGAGSLDRSQTDQVTTLGTPIAADGNTQVGILYMASNGPSQFDAVLTFNSGGPDTNVTTRLVANDWFGTASDPAVLAGQPVVFQKRVTHPKAAAVTSLVGDGANVVATCTTVIPFAVSDTVTISGATDPNHNGVFTVASLGTSFTIATTAGATAGIASDGTTAVVTTTAAHNFVAGSTVVITNAGNGLFNGTYTVLTTPTATSFTIAHPHIGASSAGTAANPTFTVANAAAANTSTGNFLAVNNAATFITYRGVQNTDVANLQHYNTTNAGPNLNLTEAIINLPAGIAGQNLTKITFRNAAWGTTALTGLNGNGATATATLGSTTGYIVGQAVNIRGAVPATFNGTYFITAIPSGTTFQFANTTSGAATTNGTVERPGTGKGYSIYAATVRTGVPNQANADCAGATVVTTTAGVANVATDNFLSGSSTAVVTANDTSAVWFTYTAPASGNIPLLFSTCTSSFDTTIAVYTACPSPLPGTPIASNDDGTTCGTGGSRVQFIAANSQTYFIRVAGKAGAKGTFTLHVEDTPTPANGSPAAAAPAASGTGTAGDTAGTVASAFDGMTTSCGGGGDRHGVWYTYTATGNNMIEARTCQDALLNPTGTGAQANPQVVGVTNVFSTQAAGTSFLPLDTTIAVFTGTPGSLTPVSCNDDGCSVSSRVQWSGTMSTQYFIRVASKTPLTGNAALFTLHIDDPIHTDLNVPLQFNWNGICHGTITTPSLISEQTIPVTASPVIGGVHENRSDLNGYRGISDRGLLFDPTGATRNDFNYGGTVGWQGLVYTLYNTALQSDIVHLGQRGAAFSPAGTNWPAGGGTATSQSGLHPLWLAVGYDHTTATSSVTGLNAIWGPNTKLGILYHMTNVNSPGPASFQVRLTFADDAFVDVTVFGTDWYGGTGDAPPYNEVLADAAAGSGVEKQRVLGIYHGTDQTDIARDTLTGSLKVNEAVISTTSLAGLGGFDATAHGILRSITFYGISSANAATNVSIFTATLRNPASFNLNFGPSGAGTVIPNMLNLTQTGRMTVGVSRGSGSPNNITSVVVDGTSVGLSPTLALNDSGTSGDLVANDNTWSANVTYTVNMTSGAASLPFTVTDAQSRTAVGQMIFTLNAPPAQVNPGSVPAGNTGVATVTLPPSVGGPNAITSIVVNGASIGAGSINLNDSGVSPDAANNDGVWTGNINVPANALGQQAMLPFTMTDASARTGMGILSFVILGPPAGANDLGTLTQGINTLNNTQTAGGVQWYKFTLGSALGANDFLDIDTEGTAWDGTNDTHVALYDSTGAVVAVAGFGVSIDDDSGTDNLSRLSFGNTSVPRPAPGNGLTYAGGNGALTAGVYYLAVTGFVGTFNPTWQVTTNSVQVGPTTVHFALGTVPAGGPPGTFTELGTLGATSTTMNTQPLAAGGVVWFRFTLATPIAFADRTFLDIDSEGSFVSNTVIGLFHDDGSGTLVGTDNDDGSSFYSQLTYGRGTRPGMGADGLPYNGRDGATLAAGVYYLAVAENSATFGNNFIVFFTTGLTADSVTVTIARGTQPVTLPTLVTGPVNNPANGHDYYLYNNMVDGACLTWTDAEAAAVTLGGHLASIADAAENEFVRASVLRFDGADRRGWIGLNDAPPQTLNNHVWSSGEPVTFTNWAALEPNHAGGVEFYAEMIGDGTWNDQDDNGIAGCTYALIEIAANVACCAADGSCTFIPAASCTGTQQGPGSTCTPNPCPGACCCGSHCSITTAAGCTGPGVAFVGGGVCTPFSNTVPCCRGDYNKTGSPPTVQDIFDFLSGYFSNATCADTNDTGGAPTVQDIFDYLSAYFGGCP